MTNAAAPSATTLFYADERRESAATRIYRLRKCFATVQFEETGKGRIVLLAEGADVRLLGPSQLYKCFEVSHGGQIYNIFQEDLLGPWSMPVRSTRRGMVRVKEMGACA